MNRILNTNRFLASIENRFPCKMTLQKLALMSTMLDGSCTTLEISSLMGVTQGQVSTTVKSLHQVGLLEPLSPDYAAPYALTVAGRELLHEAEAAFDCRVIYQKPVPKKVAKQKRDVNAYAGKRVYHNDGPSFMPTPWANKRPNYQNDC